MSYISGISLELFLLHGFWIDPVFYEARMPDMAFFGLVLVCSIAAASLAAPVTKAVVRAATGFLLRHREKEAEVPLTLERQNLLAKKEARRRTLRKGIPLLAVVLCILFWISAGRRFVMAGREYEEELAAIRSAGIGEEAPYDPRGSAKKYITVILKQTGSRSGKNACPGSSLRRNRTGPA